MRLIILGGTRFIGRAIVEELDRAGHTLMIVHRGVREPELPEGVTHLHCERSGLSSVTEQLRAFEADGAIEVSAMNGSQSDAALGALPGGIRLLAISSCDVYRAYGSLHSDTQTDAVPLTESSPVRKRRFVDGPEYENLEVEERYLTHGAVILRLCAVYGPNDYQRRQEFVLRRIRARRTRMPIGTGNFLFSRCYVEDVARATRLAIEEHRPGEIFNIAERSTLTMRLLAERIIELSGADCDLVQVEDDRLPKDLAITAGIGQHLLVDSHKIGSVLGWSETDPEVALKRTIEWDLANPPDDEYRNGAGAREGIDPEDFSSDDEALAGRSKLGAGTVENSDPENGGPNE